MIRVVKKTKVSRVIDIFLNHNKINTMKMKSRSGKRDSTTSETYSMLWILINAHLYEPKNFRFLMDSVIYVLRAESCAKWFIDLIPYLIKPEIIICCLFKSIVRLNSFMAHGRTYQSTQIYQRRKIRGILLLSLIRSSRCGAKKKPSDSCTNTTRCFMWKKNYRWATLLKFRTISWKDSTE